MPAPNPTKVPARFHLSAGENIGAGDADEFSNREMWSRAAGLGGVSGVLESLPMGYDTLLEDHCPHVAVAGRTGRSGLSEGEWQSLMLARFLMRADVAKLLVLDEPFSCVHPDTARRMLAMLGAQARAMGQVVVVTTQDLSLGRWGDQVVLLDSGKLVEAGPPDDLLAMGGAFLRALQAYHGF
ncbi:unnamed protein product [Discosporangium mesarthrocarpum]